MLRDILFNFFHCSNPSCLLWNAAYLFGLYLLGLGMAYQIWVRPWRRHVSEYRERYSPEEEADSGILKDYNFDTQTDEAEEDENRLIGAENEPDESETEDESRFMRDVTAGAGSAAAIGLGATLFGAQSDGRKEEDADGELSEIMQRDFFGEDVHADPKLGILYQTPPVLSDDLTRIDHLELELEGDLNDLGVHRFKQIANWSDDNVAEFSQRLQLGGQIERESWVSQARHLIGLNGSRRVDEEIGVLGVDDGFRAPAEVDHAAVIAASFSRDQHVAADPALGVIFHEKPEVSDDLTRIDEISPELEHRLNQMGIYRFRQVASWSDGNVSEVANRLDVPKERIERERWLPQASELHDGTYRASQVWDNSDPSLEEYESRIDREYRGEPVRADGVLGIVYGSRPENPDDLSQIDGIGEMMAQWLNDSGVYRFRQLADWSEANVNGFADRLDLAAERIYSERWIQQAAELAGKAEFELA